MLQDRLNTLKYMEIVGAILRAIVRIVLLLGWFLLSLIQQSLGFILRTGDGRHLRLRFYRGALRILGIRIRVFNDFSPRRPLFVVANHVSYLDVFVLGSLIPAVFVSKQEVRDWPVVGWIAWLQHTIFIARRRTRAGDELTPLGEALENGFNVIMFPEGTSTDGTAVLPFKSALFEAPKRANAYTQPVSLIYRERHGSVLSEKDRQFYTWGTDAPFFNHFLKLILRPGVLVEAWIRKPISPQVDRKQLAKIAETRVSAPLKHRVNRHFS